MQNFSLFVQNTHFCFMLHIIHRCIKKPGLIDRARTFYLELNDKGLYIICLGNTTQEVPRSGDLVAHAIATKAIHFIANRYEKKIKATEEQIQTKGVDEMVQTKHSYLFSKSEVEIFDFIVLSDQSIQIKIKGPKQKITLYADAYYGRTAQNIKQGLGK